MKKLLFGLLILVVATSGQKQAATKKVEWLNLNSVVDTNNMRLKVGFHEIYIRYSLGTTVLGTDTVKFQVLADTAQIAFNYFPSANAGKDTTYTVGITGKLSGSGWDTDGTIVTYKWTKLSGPTKGKISYSTRKETTVTGNVTGTYTYQLEVTDNNGGKGRDTVIVNYKPLQTIRK